MLLDVMKYLFHLFKLFRPLNQKIHEYPKRSMIEHFKFFFFEKDFLLFFQIMRSLYFQVFSETFQSSYLLHLPSKIRVSIIVAY